MARLLFLAFVLLPTGVVGQTLPAEQGRPYYVQRFSVQDYGVENHDQNWAVVQDPRGVIYVANRTGLLEYDGDTWRSIPLPGRFARSLAVAPSGRVYVGGVGEIGFLAPDSTGRLEYRSLRQYLSGEDRAFADVWTTFVSDDGVYFQSFDRIIRWDGEQARGWKAATRFHKAFAVNGAYYVRQDGVGLMEIRGGDLRLLPQGERFAQERIDVMLPFGEKDALVVARDEGLLIKQGDTYESLLSEADAYLRGVRVYHGAQLEGGGYALTTTSGTVVLLSEEGRVLRVLGEDVGLQSDELVLYVYPDRQGGLWLALDTGLMRIDAPTPLTVFDQQQGLAGTVYSVARFGGDLYTATSQGLFRLKPEDTASDHLLPRRARFLPVSDLKTQVWNVIEAEGHLLAAANDGVYEVNGGSARLVLPGRSFTLIPSDQEPGLVFVGMKDGVALLRYRNGRWTDGGRLKGLDAGEVRSIVETEDGGLWLGTLFDGVVRAWLQDGHLARTEHYGEEAGLPKGHVSVYEIGADVIFHAPSGVFRVQAGEEGTRFAPDEGVNAVIQPGGEGSFLINMSEPGRLWVVQGGRVRVYAEKESGAFEDVTPPVLHLTGIPDRFLYVEAESGVAWIAGEQGLLRYDPSAEKDYAVPYPALVRRVTVGQDSLIYGGAGSGLEQFPELAYERNNLHFTFSAPTFNTPAETVYQYWLEGFDDGWSRWTQETKKEYTNLPEKSYRFRVRARSAQGVVSQEGVYAFEVLPPWYRTWWAYLSYVTLAAVIVWGYGHVRLRQHRRMLAYEQQVNQRLDTANARLREANDRLHHADKLKDDFLANTSHELRTPLTAILGFAGVLQEELEGDLQHFAVMIRRGGERLLDTVNAMLDMARLQADMVDVQLTDLDVAAAAREIARGLEPLAQEKGLFVRVMPESIAIPARMDRFGLERILVNLIGNAIKFTDEGGVTVLVDATEDAVHLVVRDTGIGIEREALPELFEEFHQASTGYGRTHEGNGLGLAITRRIVHVLDGEIEVDSRVGGGTVFRITLPRYDRREHVRTNGDHDPAPLFPDSTRLLLVEAPERPQLRLRHLLEPRCQLDVAVGGAEGLAALRRESYDALLIDGHLEPLPSGQSVFDALRLSTPDDIPAIAVTGFKMPGDYERFLGLGYAGHIAKPFTGRRLLLLLESVLSGKELVEEEG